MAKEAPKVHEWEGSKSGIRKHYRKILYPTAGVALVGTTTAAVVLPLMVKKIAEERTKGILEKMIPLGGPVNSLRNNKSIAQDGGKLNYLAIGDSITSGYNGFLYSDETIALDRADHNPASTIVAGSSATDYLSYADFIANDLVKAEKLRDYRNFSVEGDRIPNIREKIFRDQTALKVLKNADLISLTAGANDLLAAVEVLNVSFNALRGQSQLDRIVNINNMREKLDQILSLNRAPRTTTDGSPTRGRTDTPSSYASEADIINLVKESFSKLTNILGEGSLAGLLDIEQELLDHIFDLIQLDLATLIAEVHAASPDAKIVVLGYAFPFHLLPESLISGSIPGRTINGKPATIKNVFAEFNNTIKTICERANYIKYFDINEFEGFNEKAPKISWGTHKDESEWDRTMPNPLDIHPSTYGHQVIAGNVYQWIAEDLGLRVPKYESVQKLTDQAHIEELERIYTYAGLASYVHPTDAQGNPLGNDEIFKIIDEQEQHKPSSIINLLKQIDNPSALKAIGKFLPKLISGDEFANNYKALMDVLGANLTTAEKVHKFLELLPKILTVDAKATYEEIIPQANIAVLEPLIVDVINFKGSDKDRLVKILNIIPSAIAGGKYDGCLDSLKAGAGMDNLIAGMIYDDSMTTVEKVKNAIYYLPIIITGKYNPLVSSVLDFVKDLVDTDKIVDYLFSDSFKVSDWSDLNTNEMISKLFDVLIKYSQSDNSFGNVQGYTSKDFLVNLKAILTSLDFDKMPDDITDFVMTIANDQYGVGTTKLTEAILGFLIYISSRNEQSREYSDGSKAVAVNNAADKNLQLVRNLIVELTKVIPIKASSMSETIITQIFAMPLLGGGFKLQSGEVLPTEPKAPASPTKVYEPTTAADVVAAEKQLADAKATGDAVAIRNAQINYDDVRDRSTPEHKVAYDKYLVEQAAWQIAFAQYNKDKEAYAKNFGTLLAKLLDEIVSVSKDLGFDISSGMPTTEALKTEYILNIFQGDGITEGTWLIQDLKAMGMS